MVSISVVDVCRYPSTRTRRTLVCRQHGCIEDTRCGFFVLSLPSSPHKERPHDTRRHLHMGILWQGARGSGGEKENTKRRGREKEEEKKRRRRWERGEGGDGREEKEEMVKMGWPH